MQESLLQQARLQAGSSHTSLSDTATAARDLVASIQGAGVADRASSAAAQKLSSGLQRLVLGQPSSSATGSMSPGGSRPGTPGPGQMNAAPQACQLLK